MESNKVVENHFNILLKEAYEKGENSSEVTVEEMVTEIIIKLRHIMKET
ncbi:hypothetical protein [Peribacillus saganii]|nr:hypothetical protein [Peribacillus saganii]